MSIPHPDHFLLGTVRRTNGLAGELCLALDVDQPSRYKKVDHLFIDIHGALVPFFVTSWRVTGLQAFVKLEGLDSPEAADGYVQREVFLPLDLLPPLGDDAFYHHEVLGFEVIDETHGTLGTVEVAHDYPQHLVLQVKAGFKEVLVPMYKGVLQKVDRAGKKLYVQMPEGLLDIYLGGNSEEEEL